MNRRSAHGENASLTCPRYTVADVSHYTRVPASVVRSWTSRGRHDAIIRVAAQDGVARLSFLNLVEAHVLGALRKEYRLPLVRVRRAVDYLRDHEGVEHPLAHRSLLTNRRDLFVEAFGLAEGPSLVNATRFGQMVMQDLVRAHLERVEWNARGVATRLYPFCRAGHDLAAPRVIAIDPSVAFGRPMIASRGVPIAPIAARFNAGEPIADLADDYAVTPAEIEEALRWVSARAHAVAA